MNFLSSFEFWAFVFRWLHVISGVMWIGHLWYFNFTQAPTVPKIPMELRPAVTKFILPEALFWFRWGAMATIVTGLITAYFFGELWPAIKLGFGEPSPHKHFTAIGFGMWLGTIMWFNVWFIIWPNQQKVIGLVAASDDEKKIAARTASLTSRLNTLLSIPMLYCMTVVHLYPMGA
jgi:uncharacterized membrane protein